MNKEMIIRLLSGLSLATISALTDRNNGIGALKFKGVEGFNELFKIRKSICFFKGTRLFKRKFKSNRKYWGTSIVPC